MKKTPVDVQLPTRRPDWSYRMLIEEIAIRVKEAMREKDIAIFELAAKLGWSPLKVLQWIDGSLSLIGEESQDDGSLRDLVDIGMALDKRWTWSVGRGGRGPVFHGDSSDKG